MTNQPQQETRGSVWVLYMKNENTLKWVGIDKRFNLECGLQSILNGSYSVLQTKYKQTHKLQIIAETYRSGSLFVGKCNL
jgi:hypothetical protein